MRSLDEEYVTVAEAATLLRVAPSTVRRWIREGDVPAHRIGRRRVALRRADLARLITPARPAAETKNNAAVDDPVVGRRLTPEEKQHALEVMDRIQQRAKEIQARRGGLRTLGGRPTTNTARRHQPALRALDRRSPGACSLTPRM
jgi:excisionase family DNA binding protein